MNLDDVYIVDCEFDGFLDKLSKMHVMSVRYKTAEGWKTKSTCREEDVKKVFENPNNTIVGHNFITFDLPALEKVFPTLNNKATIIDTLPLSQYLYPKRTKHSLESWAKEIEGVEKQQVEDESWKGIGEEKEEIIKYYEQRRGR